MDRSAVLLSLQCIVHVVPSWRKTTVSLELFSLLWRMCFDDTKVALMVKSGTEEPELGAATYKTAQSTEYSHREYIGRHKGHLSFICM